jgi:hypothetical protein
MVKQYDCSKCPAYCCSYSRIIVSDADIKRLAKHHGLSMAVARERFTKKGLEPGERIMRHQEDVHYKSICRFLDTKTRQCTIYNARPKICREFPGATKCGYYEFLKFERETQEDPELVATTDN